MQLLLRQQPVARDLRTVSAALRMISDMERIGDQAADIAEIARDMEHSDLQNRVPMEKMAHSVIARDDQVDDLFLQVRRKLTELIGAGESGEICLDLLMIAKYFERIGDHACNIAQWVEYAITGQYEDD